MVIQYPYQLWVLSHNADALKDGNGNYVAVSGGMQLISGCRDEANSKGQTVQLADGSKQVYNSLIHLPLSASDVAEGTSVEVRNNVNGVRVAAKALRFTRGQLHCRLWV